MSVKQSLEQTAADCLKKKKSVHYTDLFFYKMSYTPMKQVRKTEV